MRTIEIGVRDKIARQTSKEVYVCGNSDFTVVFSFDPEWDAYSAKTARFKYNGIYQEVPFTGDTCPMPIIHDTTAIQVGVYAGDLHTTTAAVVQARKSILCGGEPQYVPPDLYTQLKATLADILKRLEALEKGESGGGGGDTPDVPDEPDVPDPPVAQKLAAPVIRLETDGELDDGGGEDDTGGDTSDDGSYTPAILGVAILGRTILGKTDVGGTAQPLSAPTIYLETVADELSKLSAPVIELQKEDE